MIEGTTISASYHPYQDSSRDLLDGTRAALLQASERGQARIKRARKAAAENLRRLRRRARERGFQEGARLLDQQKLQKLFELQSLYGETVNRAKQDCLELTLAVCREVLGSELKRNSESLSRRIEKALSGLIDQRSLRLRVNLKELEGVRAELHQEILDLGAVIEGDAEISPGNALIETAAGSLELNWQEHLESITRLLRAQICREAARS